MSDAEEKMRAQCALHMSPAQAAQVAGVSRWTIMRAIKSQDLLAIRDNRNQWRITAEALEGWKASTVRTQEDLHTPHTKSLMLELQTKLAAESSRADVAEVMLAGERKALDEVRADRDAWKEQAAALLAAPQTADLGLGMQPRPERVIAEDALALHLQAEPAEPSK